MSEESKGGLLPKEWCERMRDGAESEAEKEDYAKLAEQWSSGDDAP